MKPSRRSFLEAGLALPTLLGSSPSFFPRSQHQKAFSKIRLSIPGLRFTVKICDTMSRSVPRAASRPILAVIKNNGYGMGVAKVAQILESQPEIFGFAVVKLHEAISLRDAGIRKPLLLLGPFDEQNLADAATRASCP